MLFLTDVLLSAPAAPAVDLVNISIANAGIVAVLGYAVVFFGLILLMLVVMAMGKAFMAKDAKAKAAPAPAAAPAAADASTPYTLTSPLMRTKDELAKVNCMDWGRPTLTISERYCLFMRSELSLKSNISVLNFI